MLKFVNNLLTNWFSSMLLRLFHGDTISKLCLRASNIATSNGNDATSVANVATSIANDATSPSNIATNDATSEEMNLFLWVHKKELELINDLRQIINSARSHVAATANSEVTMMNWNIGNRINHGVLNNERAEYGQQIVSQVATQLQEEYGTKGFEIRSIQRMMQFARLLRA